MSSTSQDQENGTTSTTQKKYKGVRRRKWGKWVSEIRVPGTQERLWLGSYSKPEAAAVAHDMAFFYLQGQPTTSWEKFNFPHLLPTCFKTNMSPRSIQKAASDAGMAIDAQFLVKSISPENSGVKPEREVQGHGDLEEELWKDVDDGSYGTWEGSGSSTDQEEALSISVEDYL